ncbi:hypothetical protein CIG75_05425 [Tumebacillus algifaecis]|uniref:Uncharacterized protein n=1 Tax=Tumebacillus algifaecis TaxID=1214604 RepID=A0A223CYV0_9BACL|nr:hypothetical protein [Tumebacillus algifaecis]ASS74488.1 hypothetical protein CIG75_05425 [Tumebacillus algifaecis]
MITNNTMFIEKAVKDSSDFLLEQLEGLKAHLERVIPLGNDEKGIGKSQVQNLLRASQTASGIPELKLFVRYQMGRDGGNGWAHMHEGKKFGDRMVAVLNRIDGEAKKIASDVMECDGVTELGMRLVERFFVYMHWQFTYSSSTIKKKNDNRTRTEDRNSHGSDRLKGYKGHQKGGGR